MSAAAPRDREEVVDLMLGASTIEECEAARVAALHWIDEHPEDAQPILQAGEQLAMVRSALELAGGSADGSHATP